MKYLASGIFILASVSTAFAAVGDYKEISCTDSYFTANNCTACFEGGKIAPNGSISGLYDTWTNKNTSEQIIYKDEQVMPEMIAVSSGTTFTANPNDPMAFWKYGNDIIWTDSATGTGKQEFMLEAGKTVKFLEGDLGASYTLQSTDLATGDVVGVLKFPLSYHNIDADGNEGAKETHIECVSYVADGMIAKVVPVEVVKPLPEPEKMTKVKTGPESFILFALALLVAAGAIALRSRKA